MTPERFKYLDKNIDAKLTKEEMLLGWHFCDEFDGLLIGPDSTEFRDCCTCYSREDIKRLCTCKVRMPKECGGEDNGIQSI
jgi:hypothetical protein